LLVNYCEKGMCGRGSIAQRTESPAENGGAAGRHFIRRGRNGVDYQQFWQSEVGAGGIKRETKKKKPRFGGESRRRARSGTKYRKRIKDGSASRGGKKRGRVGQRFVPTRREQRGARGSRGT